MMILLEKTALWTILEKVSQPHLCCCDPRRFLIFDVTN